MDAKTFLEANGRERAKAVAEVAGTSIEYFSQIAHGHRRASPKLAKRLVEASGGELTIPELLPHIFGLVDSAPGDQQSEQVSA